MKTRDTFLKKCFIGVKKNLNFLFFSDVSTSLSFRCCEKLIEDNALPVIFRIVNYGNRSLPWISIKQMAFSILMNLAKVCITSSSNLRFCPRIED